MVFRGACLTCFATCFTFFAACLPVCFIVVFEPFCTR